MNPTLYLIDGHAQIYRAYYAMENLRSPAGTPTGAAFGFARMVADLQRNHKPDAIIAVFDSPGKTFRHERFPDYKATRKSPPPELTQQIPLVHEIVEAYRIPICALDGFEADDLIGTLARQAREQGWDVVLVTGDKDCGQLICDGVRIHDPSKGIFIDIDSFTEKKGLPPDKLVDLMGLWGDSSDNIPGVPGIGEKIGVQLIRQYGTLENLLDHADEIKGKRGEILRASRDLALMSKELATIDCHAPVTLDLEAAKPKQPDHVKLRDIFTRLDFRSLLSRLEEPEGESPAVVQETVAYTLVDNPDAFHHFMDQLRAQTFFAFDTETTGLDPLRDKLVGLSFSWLEKTGHYLPFRGPMGAQVLPAVCLEQLKEVFENADVGKTGHNLRFDALVLRRVGIKLAGCAFDSLIASSVADGHLQEHNLKTLARRYCSCVMTPIADLIGTGRNQTTMDLVPMADVTAYACADADFSLRLYGCLDKRLDERGARELFEQVEMPLSDVLTEMQALGIRLDCDLLAEESRETGELLDSLTEEIHQLAGHPFNIASPKQLAVVLFEEMGLPVVRKTQTGPSTDESVLQELAHVHDSEIADRILNTGCTPS